MPKGLDLWDQFDANCRSKPYQFPQLIRTESMFMSDEIRNGSESKGRALVISETEVDGIQSPV